MHRRRAAETAWRRSAQGQLYPFQGLTVAVGFPKGAVPEPEPILSEGWSFRRAFTITPMTLAVTGALTVLVIAAWALLRRVVGGDRRAKGSPIDVAFAPVGTDGAVAPLFGDDAHSPVEFVPPDGIRPALMSVLMYERARPVDVSATIVDLAVRGYIHIEEIRDGKDFKLDRQSHDLDDLHPYEQKLIKAIFASGRNEIELSDLDQKFASKTDDVLDELYKQVVTEGWFDVRPDRVRTKWRWRGFFITFVALLALVGAIVFTKLALVMLPLVLFGFLVWFGAGAMPRRTAAGTGVYRRSLGFQEFIVDSEAPRARWAEQRNIFSEYLPYAIVLGEAAALGTDLRVARRRRGGHRRQLVPRQPAAVRAAPVDVDVELHVFRRDHAHLDAARHQRQQRVERVQRQQLQLQLIERLVRRRWWRRWRRLLVAAAVESDPQHPVGVDGRGVPGV